MTDKMKVYTKIMKKLKKMMPQTPQNQMVTTAMMIAGIVLGLKPTKRLKILAQLVTKHEDKIPDIVFML